jgi:hypothetical protein
MSWGSFVEAFRPDTLLDRSGDPLGGSARPREALAGGRRAGAQWSGWMHYMARASAARQIAGGGSGCTACRAIDHSHSSCTGTTVLRLECACAYAWARELDHTAETSVTAECQSPLLSANLTVGEHACACGGRPTRWTSSRPAREGFPYLEEHSYVGLKLPPRGRAGGNISTHV